MTRRGAPEKWPAWMLIDALAERVARHSEFWEQRRDRRAVFSFAFHHILKSVATAVRTHESAGTWTANLVAYWADEYLSSMRSCGAAGSPWSRCTEVWEDLWLPLLAHCQQGLPRAIGRAGRNADAKAEYKRFAAVVASEIDSVASAVFQRYGGSPQAGGLPDSAQLINLILEQWEDAPREQSARWPRAAEPPRRFLRGVRCLVYPRHWPRT